MLLCLVLEKHILKTNINCEKIKDFIETIQKIHYLINIKK